MFPPSPLPSTTTTTLTLMAALPTALLVTLLSLECANTNTARFDHWLVETSSVRVRQTQPQVFQDTRPKRGWATDLCASRAGPVRPDHRLQSRRGFTSGQNSGEG